MKSALIIGAGPAGLMAAECLASAGVKVTITEAKSSPARKLLMAGKSGLNLTKNEPIDQFMSVYGDLPKALDTALRNFGPTEIMSWARGLDQEIFTGSTGRVFPKAMKASPLLRAWLARLNEKSVDLKLGWKWQGWDGESSLFNTPDGVQSIDADVTIMAVGGKSWSKLGSDGAWAEGIGVPLAPFEPANVGFLVDWSPHMARHFGSPVKPAGLKVDGVMHRGEFVVSKTGIEGGGVYTVSAKLRDGASLEIDLLPDLSLQQVQNRLRKPRGKASMSTHLRKTLGLSPVKIGLIQEFLRPLPNLNSLGSRLKSLSIPLQGPRPIDEAISTAGGVKFAAMNDDLMLNDRPGVFCAGEMLDWEAPTGGYLITASMATGKHAGEAAARWLKPL